MANILLTSSADGVGRQAAQVLVERGHRVVLHASTDARADVLRTSVPAAAGIVVGDLASLAETQRVAKAASAGGPFDAIVFNGAGYEPSLLRPLTHDGLERSFQVNVLAPYLLTALLARPRRLVYLSGHSHAHGGRRPGPLSAADAGWDAAEAYRDTQLQVVTLALAIARRWPTVTSNAVDPGPLVAGESAHPGPRGLTDGVDTQVWLATSDETEAVGSGRYLRRRRPVRANPAAYDHALQNELLATCTDLCGVVLPT